jgi:hypothetical protein
MTNNLRSFKKKKVMNITEASPTPKLLIIPSIELKKLVRKLKLNSEGILASLKKLVESIL